MNTKIDSWDTRLLCVVTLVLFESYLDSSEIQAVTCISEQRKDLDNYAQSASLNYETFQRKWDELHAALLELIKDIEGKAKFECTQMIHSFKLENISVNLELINRMKQTKDVSFHVQMAIQDKVVRKIHGDNQYGHEPVFTEKLKYTLVYINEPTILACKLSMPDKSVTWRHDNKKVEETETVKFVDKKCNHWLAISQAHSTDTGHYSCSCGKSSTTAFLQVLENPLKITEDLHVATKDKDVRENMDIILCCKINLHTNKVIWRHNGKEIKCDRHHASFRQQEHQLTIQNAKFEDDGKYMIDFGAVTSCTTLYIKGNLNLLLKNQLAEDLYKNWVRGALGLKYLKLGLEAFSDNIVENHHSKILTTLLSTGNTCAKCSLEFLLPLHKKEHCPKPSKCLCSKQPRKRNKCPNGGFCSKFYDLILWDHRFKDPLLTNTNIQKWSSDPWSVATCYISTPGYEDRKSAKEVDCAGLLSIFINNIFFHRSLGDVEIDGETDLFKKVHVNIQLR
ncbi:uncharacterized protein LOC123523486 [Mercenaria mercenaria]|uniref:uncharacterized protein LOC123523486 n=1 Tax=Mercenaria mercenaria TaxID=6596 RepID=UPI00234F2DE5|nr:uncharacterized protein LOC123523486 [Mercenaria mercenaria]